MNDDALRGWFRTDSGYKGWSVRSSIRVGSHPTLQGVLIGHGFSMPARNVMTKLLTNLNGEGSLEAGLDVVRDDELNTEPCDE